ncbi:MAG TPA: hypothetical protein VKF41_09745 [Bryobacteraceae bacterium]|nr:hypothetical protein [Bryobacteraceae bacterium]
MDRVEIEQTLEQRAPQAQPYDDIVKDAIRATKQAEGLKGAAIQKLLSLREQIDADLATLGYDPQSAIIPPHHNGTFRRVPIITPGDSELKRSPGPKPFKNLDLASVGKIILSEHGGGPLHGKEIERLAKAGGYEQGGAHWQGYLAIALKRVGGVENVGRNNWKLNPQISPEPIGRKKS